MSANTIHVEAREEALRVIARFNQEILAQSECRYIPRFKGRYLYVDREDFGSVGTICRLEYNRRNLLFARSSTANNGSQFSYCVELPLLH